MTGTRTTTAPPSHSARAPSSAGSADPPARRRRQASGFGEGLHGFVVPLAGDADAGRGLPQLGDVLVGERQPGGTGVLLDPLDPARAGDRDDRGAPGEQP